MLATTAEVQEVRVTGVRLRTPIAAGVASIVGIAMVVAAKAGSREECLRSTVLICVVSAEPISVLTII